LLSSLCSTIGFSGCTRPFLQRVLPSAMAGAAAAAPRGGLGCDWGEDDGLPRADERDDAAGGQLPWLHRVWRAADERFLVPLLGGEAAWEAQEQALRSERGAYTELLSRA
jgi:hypothetical protein